MCAAGDKEWPSVVHRLFYKSQITSRLPLMMLQRKMRLLTMVMRDFGEP